MPQKKNPPVVQKPMRRPLQGSYLVNPPVRRRVQNRPVQRRPLLPNYINRIDSRPPYRYPIRRQQVQPIRRRTTTRTPKIFCSNSQLNKKCDALGLKTYTEAVSHVLGPDRFKVSCVEPNSDTNLVFFDCPSNLFNCDNVTLVNSYIPSCGFNECLRSASWIKFNCIPRQRRARSVTTPGDDFRERTVLDQRRRGIKILASGRIKAIFSGSKTASATPVPVSVIVSPTEGISPTNLGSFHPTSSDVSSLINKETAAPLNTSTLSILSHSTATDSSSITTTVRQTPETSTAKTSAPSTSTSVKAKIEAPPSSSVANSVVVEEVPSVGSSLRNNIVSIGPEVTSSPSFASEDTPVSTPAFSSSLGSDITSVTEGELSATTETSTDAETLTPDNLSLSGNVETTSSSSVSVESSTDSIVGEVISAGTTGIVPQPTAPTTISVSTSKPSGSGTNSIDVEVGSKPGIVTFLSETGVIAPSNASGVDTSSSLSTATATNLMSNPLPLRKGELSSSDTSKLATKSDYVLTVVDPKPVLRNKPSNSGNNLDVPPILPYLALNPDESLNPGSVDSANIVIKDKDSSCPPLVINIDSPLASKKGDKDESSEEDDDCGDEEHDDCSSFSQVTQNDNKNLDSILDALILPAASNIVTTLHHPPLILGSGANSDVIYPDNLKTGSTFDDTSTDAAKNLEIYLNSFLHSVNSEKEDNKDFISNSASLDSTKGLLDIVSSGLEINIDSPFYAGKEPADGTPAVVSNVDSNSNSGLGIHIDSSLSSGKEPTKSDGASDSSNVDSNSGLEIHIDSSFSSEKGETDSDSTNSGSNIYIDSNLNSGNSEIGAGSSSNSGLEIYIDSSLNSGKGTNVDSESWDKPTGNNFEGVSSSNSNTPILPELIINIDSSLASGSHDKPNLGVSTGNSDKDDGEKNGESHSTDSDAFSGLAVNIDSTVLDNIDNNGHQNAHGGSSNNGKGKICSNSVYNERCKFLGHTTVENNRLPVEGFLVSCEESQSSPSLVLYDCPSGMLSCNTLVQALNLVPGCAFGECSTAGYIKFKCNPSLRSFHSQTILTKTLKLDERNITLFYPSDAEVLKIKGNSDGTDFKIKESAIASNDSNSFVFLAMDKDANKNTSEGDYSDKTETKDVVNNNNNKSTMDDILGAEAPLEENSTEKILLLNPSSSTRTPIKDIINSAAANRPVLSNIANVISSLRPKDSASSDSDKTLRRNVVSLPLYPWYTSPFYIPL